jgi:hypothetical protein
MPSNPPTAEQIERLQRRRTRLVFIQAIFFLIWQVTYFSIEQPDYDVARTVSHVRVGAYIVWAVLLLAFIGTGGGLAWSREVKAILNDETTIEHRRRALSLGFWAAMGSAIGCYVVALFEPVGSQEVIHIVLSAGIATALLNFGFLERRAQQDG